MLDRCARALTEAWCHLATFLPDGRVDAVPDGTLVSTTAPTEDLRGPLTVTSNAGHHTLASARELVAAQGRLLAVDTLVGHADELRRVVEADGMQRIVERQFMTTEVAVLRSPVQRARIALAADVDALRELQTHAFGMDPRASACLVSATSLSASPHAVIFDQHGTALSMATAHPTPTGIGVFGVATRSDARRQGLASEVVAAAVAAAAELTEATMVWLQANDDVAGAYVSMGFEASAWSEVWIDGWV